MIIVIVIVIQMNGISHPTFFNISQGVTLSGMDAQEAAALALGLAIKKNTHNAYVLLLSSSIYLCRSILISPILISFRLPFRLFYDYQSDRVGSLIQSQLQREGSHCLGRWNSKSATQFDQTQSCLLFVQPQSNWSPPTGIHLDLYQLTC